MLMKQTSYHSYPKYSETLMLSMLGKNCSRWQFEIFFSYFSQKTDFDISCKLSPQQIVYSEDNMHGITKSIFWKKIRTSNSVFRDNKCTPTMNFSVFLLLWPWKLGQGHQNQIYYVQIIYPWKFDKNPTTGSQDIVQTRKSHTDANAKADANWIHICQPTLPEGLWDLEMDKLFANSGDSDHQMRHSDLGLHCLQITLLGISRLQWVIWSYE